MVLAIRGAINVRRNDAALIRDAVRRLVGRLMSENSIKEEDLVSIMFSQTKDLTQANPASALREEGYASVPLFCTQEPKYKGSMPRVIRVLLTLNASEKRELFPQYLEGAAALRVDILTG